MSKSTLLGAVLASLATTMVGSGAMAQEDTELSTDFTLEDGRDVIVIGGQIGQGEARTATTHVRNREKAQWTVSATAYVDYYLSEMLALELGMGLVGKGHRFKRTNDNNRQYGPWYAQIPFGVKVNVANVRIGVLCALDVGLWGKVRGLNGQKIEEKAIDWSSDGKDGSTHRVNVAPKLTLGYAFPVKGGYVVPNFEWSMDVLQDTVIGDEDRSFRHMTLMLNLAAEYGL